MNKAASESPRNEILLEKQLGKILGEVAWLQGWQVVRNPAPGGRHFDLLAIIPLPDGGSAELLVACRDLPRPSQFPSIAITNKPDKYGKRNPVVPALAAPWISPRMEELCRKHHWSWFDLAGNCRISIPGALLIERTGFEPVHSRPRPEANLGTPESARVIRTLLACKDPTRKWTQRDLCKEAHVSIGLANKVVRYLREQAYLMDLPERRGFRLHDPLGLLREWNAAYRFERQTPMECFTLLKPADIHTRLAELEFEQPVVDRFAYASFSAAEIQAPAVRQNRVWLYAKVGEHDELLDHLEAKTVDSGANLMILTPDDVEVLDEPDFGKGRLRATNPVQTYVDVFHSGGRGEEAAEAVLAQVLMPRWRNAGLAL